MDDDKASGEWHERTKAMAARLDVHGDFVHVPQLSRALGISSTTIYAQMRRGNFPMPHRKVGNVCVVRLDDYVRWFESDAGATQAGPSATAQPLANAAPCQPMPGAGATLPSPAPKAKALKSDRLPSGETRVDFKARIQREVLANMRRKGFDV